MACGLSFCLADSWFISAYDEILTPVMILLWSFLIAEGDCNGCDVVIAPRNERNIRYGRSGQFCSWEGGDE